MANHSVETAFNVPVTPDEATLLEECFLTAEDICNDFPTVPLEGLEAARACYATRSNTFRTLFPEQDDEDDPFASFLGLWSDPEFPSFGTDITVEEAPDGSGLVAFIRGHEADIDALAMLIQKVCTSALPFGFEWASTCDHFRPNQHGGGYLVITGSEIVGNSTRSMIETAMRSLLRETKSLSTITTARVTLSVAVFDEQLMWRSAHAAYEQANGTADDGDFMDICGTDQEPDICACLEMIFDPGESPRGIEILDSLAAIGPIT